MCTQVDTIYNPIKPIAEAYRKTGVSRNTLSYMLINQFHFPEDFKDCLEHYYILHSNGSKFMNRIYEGTVEREGKEFLVVYKNCTPFAVKRANEIKLSYRVPLPVFNLPNYVLVSIVEDNEGND
jgi:hypothetical protein